MKPIMTITAMALCAGGLQGEVVFSDHFDDLNDGNLSSQNGWGGFFGNGITVGPSYALEGGKGTLGSTAAAWNTAQHASTAVNYSSEATVRFYTCLANYTGTSCQVTLVASTGANNGEKIECRLNQTNLQFAGLGGYSILYPTGTWDPDQSYLCVLKLDSTDATNLVMSAVVLDATVAIPDEGSFSYAASRSIPRSTANFSYDNIAFATTNNVTMMDLVQLASTWADVQANYGAQAGDTDSDGISDVDEISGLLNTYDIAGDPTGPPGAPTLPNNSDSDGDGLFDGDEINGTKNAFDASGNWVGAGNGGAPTNPNSSDTDGDGLLDKWETDNELDPRDDGTLDPYNGANGDPDGDTLINIDEQSGLAGYDPTDPWNEDSDGDGLFDDEEVYGTLNAVGPGDSTDPNDADSDDDGLSDGEEITGELNPFLGGVLDAGYPNADGDPTDPNYEFTDGDSMTDKEETDNRLDPNSDASPNGDSDDPDGDNLENIEEIQTYGTDPRDNDSDDDGLFDDEEVFDYSTDPLDSDSDDDTINDFHEVNGTLNTIGPNEPTDPLLADSDNDGAGDSIEIFAAVPSDPNDALLLPAITPAAYWPLDAASGGTAVEWVKAENGIAPSGDVERVAGVPELGGMAANIDGRNTNGDYFNLPQLTGLQGAVSVTACGWFNIGSNNNQYMGLFATRGEGPSGNQNWGINAYGNYGAASSDGAIDNRTPVNAIGSSSGNSSTPIDADVWVHVALVYDSVTDTVTNYIDGQADTTMVNTYPTALTGMGWKIGVDANDLNARDFGGVIDDLAIFPVALPADEIEAIYDAAIYDGDSIGAKYGITPPLAPAPLKVTSVVYDSVASTVDLTWDSKDGAASYKIVESADLSTPVLTWATVPGAGSIANGGDSTSYLITGATNTIRFYAVVEN